MERLTARGGQRRGWQKTGGPFRGGEGLMPQVRERAPVNPWRCDGRACLEDGERFDVSGV